MRRHSPPLTLSFVVVCSSLAVVTAALDLCQVGRKLTAATRDVDGSLSAQCKTFVSEDCSVSCQWAPSCRDSAGWHQYASGSRSFISGVRIDAQRRLLLRCCVSLASMISKCQWTSRSSIDQLAHLPTTELDTDPTTETVIRDILINPKSPPASLELRAEVCAIERERSTCDIAKMVDEEMHDFRLLLLRSSRSKLLRRTKYERQNHIRLMQKLFSSATEVKEPLRLEPNSYGKQIAPKLRPVESSNDLPDDKKKTGEKSSFPPRPEPSWTKKPKQGPELNDRQPSATKTPRTSADKKQCPRQPGWQPCVGKSEANSRLHTCCSALTPGCQELCNYDINRDKLISAALSGRCPVEELGGLIKCAAVDKDHTKCCSALGVFEEDRDLCKPLCNPRAGLPTVDFTFLPCLDQLTVIARCFWASVQPA